MEAGAISDDEASLIAPRLVALVELLEKWESAARTSYGPIEPGKTLDER